MRILVTGGCGFVGRHFACRLLDEGHDVCIVDNLSAGLPFSEWLFKPNHAPEYWVRDVRHFFNKVHRASDFNLVIHCAAVVGGRLKIEGDPLAVATDLAIDSDLFNWCVRADKKPTVIYFSSSAAYPTYLQQELSHRPLEEGAIKFGHEIGRPDMTYGWSKLTGELLAHFAVEKYGLDVKIYRPFGGYGEDQDESYPFPAILRRVLNRENPIMVWGTGRQVRDFIHIDDVVNVVLTTWHRLAPGEALNIGRGIPVSFAELAETMCEVAGHKASVVGDLSKPSGVYYRVADVAKLMTLYPEPFLSLEEGIRRSLDTTRVADVV